MISRMQTLKRKLESLQQEEQELQSHTAKRIKHLQDLYEIPSLADVKYEDWSRTRLDRLIVDYLLRAGYSSSAAALAKEKDIGDLVDLDTFIQCHKIASNLARGDPRDALTWCNQNRTALQKLPADQLKHNLEFELRLQQYIELVRIGTTAKKMEAMLHAQKFLAPHSSTYSEQIMHAAGLLAQMPPSQQPSSTIPNGVGDGVTNMSSSERSPYASLFSPQRWSFLSDLFIETHHTLLSLPTRPLLHVALTAGLSALKTPSCHSAFNPTSATTTSHPRVALTGASSTTTTNGEAENAESSTAGPNTSNIAQMNPSLCPICSTELNDLARNVPYAHHTKSYVEPDPVVLPNNRIYGRGRLEEYARKLRNSGLLAEGQVKDPVLGSVYSWDEVGKVYIS